MILEPCRLLVARAPPWSLWPTSPGPAGRLGAEAFSLPPDGAAGQVASRPAGVGLVGLGRRRAPPAPGGWARARTPVGGRGRRGLAVCRQRDRPVAAAALASEGPGAGRPLDGALPVGAPTPWDGVLSRYRAVTAKVGLADRGADFGRSTRSVRRGRRPRERTRQERPVRDVRPSNARVQRRRRQGEHRHGGEGACRRQGAAEPAAAEAAAGAAPRTARWACFEWRAR